MFVNISCLTYFVSLCYIFQIPLFLCIFCLLYFSLSSSFLFLCSLNPFLSLFLFYFSTLFYIFSLQLFIPGKLFINQTGGGHCHGPLKHSCLSDQNLTWWKIRPKKCVDLVMIKPSFKRWIHFPRVMWIKNAYPLLHLLLYFVCNTYQWPIVWNDLESH